MKETFGGQIQLTEPTVFDHEMTTLLLNFYGRVLLLPLFYKKSPFGVTHTFQSENIFSKLE